MKLEEFTKNFNKIRNEWHETTKKINKNGGQGNTLESLLGIKENNISAPDLGEIELKTINITNAGYSSRLISLFSFNKKVWKMDQIKAIKKYGSLNKDGRYGMYYTLTTKPNSAGLFIWLEDEDKIQIRNIDGTLLLDYPILSVVEKFNFKIKNMILIYSEREERNGIYYYKYLIDRYFNGGTNKNIIRQLLKENHITIDLRLHPKKSKETGRESSRNHGTWFRIKEKNLEKLFSKNIEI